MSIYYQSTETWEFFFSTDLGQRFRIGQNIPEHFVPLVLTNWPDGRVRRLLESFGDKEIKNPDPNFQPKEK